MRNTIGIIIGLFIGGMVNGFITNLNGTWVQLPPGVDMKTPEGIAAGMHLLEWKHFAVVFAAHAVGTLVAAIIATLIAKPKRIYIPVIIGTIFLVAGIYMVTIIPAPILFSITDLLFAYLPMAFLGYALVKLPLRANDVITPQQPGKYS